MARTSRTKCTSCGRLMPRIKLVPSYRRIFGEMQKQYLCIICAKRRGIPVRKTRYRVIHGTSTARRRSPRRKTEA